MTLEEWIVAVTLVLVALVPVILFFGNRRVSVRMEKGRRGSTRGDGEPAANDRAAALSRLVQIALEEKTK